MTLLWNPTSGAFHSKTSYLTDKGDGVRKKGVLSRWKQPEKMADFLPSPKPSESKMNDFYCFDRLASEQRIMGSESAWKNSLRSFKSLFRGLSAFFSFLLLLNPSSRAHHLKTNYLSDKGLCGIKEVNQELMAWEDWQTHVQKAYLPLRFG